MLPFLDSKKTAAGIITKRLGKSGDLETKSEVQAPDSKLPEGLMSVAEDMLRAVNEKSTIGIAHCFKHAFEILDSAPHEEGEHLNEGEE